MSSPGPSKPPASKPPAPMHPASTKLCSSTCSYPTCADSCSCFHKSGMGGPLCACFNNYLRAVLKRNEAKMRAVELVDATKKMDKELELKEETERVLTEEEPNTSPSKKTQYQFRRKKFGLTTLYL